jgi:hypothetical protein
LNVQPVAKGRIEKMYSKAFLIVAAAVGSAPAQNVGGWEGQSVYEMMKISQSNDTLVLVSGSEFVFYPFGKTLSVSEFSRRMIKGGLKKIDSTIIHDEKVFSATSNDGKVTYLNIERAGNLNVQIVSAWYTTPKLEMKNGIRIGNPKGKVFRVYLAKPEIQQFEKINVLELVSALDGSWHFYTFNKNQLKRIEIRSDYKIE